MAFACGNLFAADPLTGGGKKFKAVLLSSAQSNSRELRRFVQAGYNTAVLYLTDEDSRKATKTATERILTTGLDLYYWIEVARNPAMAKTHPEWMASIQTHPEWRRHFPTFPQPATNEVVKNYPWVPVLYQETFEPHRARVADLLRDLPSPKGIFLNDLQGAPSACGCGNSYCRWTTDYGPKLTAARLPNDAAARFVAAVAKLAPQAKIVPVWTTECLEKDGPPGAPCDGVGCFSGKCWREYTAQLMPVADQCDTIGVLLPFHAFEKERTAYGDHAEWQKHALTSFIEIPPKRGGKAIPLNRLIAVLQGWDLTPAQQTLQVKQSEDAGVGGYLLALAKIDQSWEPRLLKVPQFKSADGTDVHAH
ncbi:MAG: hypothetical protein DME26_19835 [Verrucomicrobia bacterium]|nr:MAG: hypothetical protein DME26_19835 [Verrucomicrobiota bacterium]